MPSASKSIFDVMETAAVEEKPAVPAEIAATAEQQRMMAESGRLEEVHYIGPHGKMIPGYYSAEERAFLPKFKVD